MSQLFCRTPFSTLELTADSIYTCCPGWLPQKLARAGTDPQKVWNGPVLQQIRASILDGSFRFCQPCCASLSRVRGGDTRNYGAVRPVDQVTDQRLRAMIAAGKLVADHGPDTLVISNDPSCNLRCPSCRKELLMLSPAESQTKADQALGYLWAFRDDVRNLRLSLSGDPFASHMCRMLFKELSPQEWPDLRIHLSTNGVLLTPQRWEALGDARNMISSILVSIDAATPQTYARLRVGGSWTRLMENLEFISELRRNRSIRQFSINMLVQHDNWREMPAFAAMGRRLKVDEVKFSVLRQWAAVADDEFRQKAVHLPAHPDHAAFRQLLQHEAFGNVSGVNLSNLTGLVAANRPPKTAPQD